MRWMIKPILNIVVSAVAICNAFGGTYVADNSTGISVSTSGVPSITRGPGSVVATSGGGSGTGTISGTISTTFHWHPSLLPNGQPDPDDLAPAKVVILESSDAWGDAKTYPAGSPTATCQTGLSTTGQSTTNYTVPITTPIPYPPYLIIIGTDAYCRKTQTCPRVVTGGSTVTVTCSPSVSVTAANGPYSVNLNYSVAAYPLIVSVSDTVLDSGEYYGEVSRRHSASLSTTAPGVSFQNHFWTLQGGTIKSYTHDDATVNSTGYVTNLATSDLQVSSPYWSWVYGGDWDVSCTADIAYGSYTYGSISAKRTVHVEEPTFSMVAETSNWTAQVAFGLHSNGDPTFVESTTSMPVGILYTFGGSKCPHFPPGTFGNAQLIKAQWESTLGYADIFTNGDFYLDTTYFYKSTVSGGSTIEEFDTPAYSLPLPCAVQVYTDFEIHQMYRSAGTGAQDITQYEQDWDWNGIYPTYSGIISSPTLGLHSLNYNHPTWNHVLKL